MDKIALPNLLQSGKEYTYVETFEIYDLAGRKACAEENERIRHDNENKKNEVDSYNERRERETDIENTRRSKEAEKKEIELNRQRRKKILIISAVISFVLAIFFAVVSESGMGFIIGFLISFALLYFLLGKLIKEKREYADWVEFEQKDFQARSLKNYTFHPSGTIQCSSCGTKTKIDTKDTDSTCPNCHSEIFVVSEMEANVIVKPLVRK